MDWKEKEKKKKKKKLELFNDCLAWIQGGYLVTIYYQNERKVCSPHLLKGDTK